jgi:hypothetical protein
VITAASAFAVVPLDVPVGWSDPKDVNMVHALLVLGGIPLLLAGRAPHRHRGAEGPGVRGRRRGRREWALVT